MDVLLESKLSTELQELYLENKEWLSQILFLEDEMRFFQKLFGENLFLVARSHTAKDIETVSKSLFSLEERMAVLKNLAQQHQHLLESIITDAKQTVNLTLIEQNATITKEIRLLFQANRLVKRELFELVEGVAGYAKI